MATAKGDRAKSTSVVNPFRLAELRAILGPELDDRAIANLLLRADGVVERAVNFFFDSPVPQRERGAHAAKAAEAAPASSCADRLEPIPQAVKDLPSKVKELPKAIKACDPPKENIKWPKHLGSISVVAYTTVDVAPATLPVGSTVRISRTSTNEAHKAPLKKSQKLSNHSTKRAEKKDYILRWKVDSVGECGRLPSEISKPVAVLIDAGWLEVGGSTASVPDSSRKFANVSIALSLNLRKIEIPAKPGLTETEEVNPAHEAMIRLLMMLGYSPRVPSEVLEVASELEAEKPSMPLLDADKPSLPDCNPERLIDSDPAVGSCIDLDDEELNGTEKPKSAEEEGKLSNAHIDILFDETEQRHRNLPEQPQPVAMQTVLRDYQRQGLWWLRQREIKRVNKDDEREQLHPLWAEYRLPDETPLYVKMMGSRVSLERPQASSRGLGGILSDEMGLGKTLQLLSLVVLDKPFVPQGADRTCVGAAHAEGSPNGHAADTDHERAGRPPPIDTLQDPESEEDPDFLPSRHRSRAEPTPRSTRRSHRTSAGHAAGHGSGAENTSPDGQVGESPCPADLVDLTADDSCHTAAAASCGAARSSPRRGTAPRIASLGANKRKLEPAAEASPQGAVSLQSRLMMGGGPKRVSGGTLVICPMSILGQWEDEISAHVQPGHLRVAVHYGGDRTLSANYLARPDVVLTTYGVVSAEYSRLGQASGGPATGRTVLYAIDWHRIIIDEAHYIKGRHTQVTQAVLALKGERRWAVTGTPVQNKLDDLYPLLRFIQLEPWSEVSFWQKHVIRPFEDRKDVGALKLLHKALQPLLLRRTKESTDSAGRPILSLPPRHVELVELDFSEEERDFYDALFKQSRTKFEAFVAAGKVMNNYASILEMLLRLRQCCAHPYLVLSRSDVGSFEDHDLARLAARLAGAAAPADRPGQASAAASAAALPPFVAKVMEEIKGGAVLECPICLETVDDAVVTPCAHVFCRECINDAVRRSSGTMCPNCRAPLSRSELISVPRANRFHVDVEANWRSSAKIDALLRHLRALRPPAGGGAGDGGGDGGDGWAKSVVFSQWTGMLDLVGVALGRAGIPFTRLDGSMSQQRRADNVAAFAASPALPVLLISLKAGGVGINLTAASHVFLLDMWWNPAVDEQAIARVHRMGQTRAVHVKKLVIRNTVEQRVIELQAKKRLLVQGALGMSKDEAAALRLHDLHLLFARPA